MISEYQRGDPSQESIKEDEFNRFIIKGGSYYILVEGQRRFGILDTDHGMIKLVIPINTLAFRMKKREKGRDITLKLAVSAVRGMVGGVELIWRSNTFIYVYNTHAFVWNFNNNNAQMRRTKSFKLCGRHEDYHGHLVKYT